MSAFVVSLIDPDGWCLFLDGALLRSAPEFVSEVSEDSLLSRKSWSPEEGKGSLSDESLSIA